MMREKYYHSVNWAPWIGFAFLLTGFFFSTISNNYLLALLIVLSFLPALAVFFLLRRYSVFTTEHFLTDYYKRATGDAILETINLLDVQTVRWIGKSVILIQTNGTIKAQRLKKSDAFIAQLQKIAPNVSVITY